MKRRGSDTKTCIVDHGALYRKSPLRNLMKPRDKSVEERKYTFSFFRHSFYWVLRLLAEWKDRYVHKSNGTPFLLWWKDVWRKKWLSSGAINLMRNNNFKKNMGQTWVKNYVSFCQFCQVWASFETCFWRCLDTFLLGTHDLVLGCRVVFEQESSADMEVIASEFYQARLSFIAQWCNTEGNYLLPCIVIILAFWILVNK